MLEALLKPATVAVIGASRSPGKVGHEIVANLIGGQFGGVIVPVNPSAPDVLGLKCYPDLKTFGARVDLSVIAVPAAGVVAAIEDSVAAGAKAICVITAGFKETGQDGAAREKQLAAYCREHGVRILGPNCLGVTYTPHRMNASFAKKMPAVGGIAFFSQSGALNAAIVDWAHAGGIGLSALVSMGNKADLSETDFVTAFAADDQTKVILGYLESVNDGPAFMKAAEAAARQKPIVIFKSGVTAAGGKAASSHTGSLAGADAAYTAAFQRCGIVRARNFEQMFDFSRAFAAQPVPRGNRVAIITNAGGPGIMAADAVELAGLKVAALTPAIAEPLRQQLPAAASVGNPIDVLGDADPARYVLALNAAQADPNVDGIIVILTPQAMTQSAGTAVALASNLRGEKPVLACFMGGTDVQPGHVELQKHSIPNYPAPDRAVSALKAMCDYASWRRQPARAVKTFPVDRTEAARIVQEHLASGRLQMGEPAAKAVLRAYGFAVAPGRLAPTAEEAVRTAAEIGYPVAMKIVSPDAIHKSDVGGVKLNVATAAAVQESFPQIVQNVRKHVPNARIDGIYVEKMCAPGREVILGMLRDPQFGPMLMFGLGGIFVEVLKDVTFDLAPLTEQEALRMLEATRSYALLKGVRGQPGADIPAIVNSLQRLSQLVTDFPRIQELDINPFFAGLNGQPSVAADARITLA